MSIARYPETDLAEIAAEYDSLDLLCSAERRDTLAAWSDRKVLALCVAKGWNSDTYALICHELARFALARFAFERSVRRRIEHSI